MAPVPGVYLAAVARATKRMRLGPLVYLLPLYSPLRLVEEICMLDHLSHGRLDVGVGRGVSPWELNSTTSRMTVCARHLPRRVQMHQRRADCRRAHLPGQALCLRRRADGAAPAAAAASAVLVCLIDAVGATWAGEQGLHFVTLGPTASAKANIDAYRTALKRRGTPAQP